MDEKTRHLSTMDLFQDLSEKEREELDRITTMSTVRKGKVFYRPEEMGEVLFILKEGNVQLYRISHGGQEVRDHLAGARLSVRRDGAAGSADA